MGLKERRERERSEVRTKVINAARELFVKEGFDAVSMRKIADAVEYSPTIIYAHFRDKEALLREICKEDFAALAAAFAEIAPVADPIERIRKAGIAYARFGLARPNQYRFMFMSPPFGIVPTEEELGHTHSPDEDGYAFLMFAVREAQAAGRFRAGLVNPELIAQTLWAGLHGVVSLHISKGKDPWCKWEPLDERIQLMVDSVLRGMLADPNAGMP